MKSFTRQFILFLKGGAMGAANVIPGVSGGTIAFITEIYEELIRSITSFNVEAVRLFCRGRIPQFLEHINFRFLFPLGLGIVVSILSLARVLRYLFANYEVFVWAFFFGLILASIFFVGAQVRRWGFGPLAALLAGVAVAVSIALLNPASENDSIPYLMLCGVVAMASMIIPGLSGSFVLLLMGNYRLVMIDSVADLNLRILVPVAIGAVIGLLVLSHLLNWIFRRFHDVAVALLTGFVAGSLLTIWPWKQRLYLLDGAGEQVLKKGEPIVVGYDWQLPVLGGELALALAVMAIGFAAVWSIEKLGAGAQEEEKEKEKEES